MNRPSRQRHSTRLIVRQHSEFSIACWTRWAAMVPQERPASVVFETVLSAGIAHLPYRDPASGRWMASTRPRP